MDAGSTRRRESRKIAIFFLKVCQESRDFSCLCGGVTVHKMPRS